MHSAVTKAGSVEWLESDTLSAQALSTQAFTAHNIKRRSCFSGGCLALPFPLLPTAKLWPSAQLYQCSPPASTIVIGSWVVGRGSWAVGRVHLEPWLASFLRPPISHPKVNFVKNTLLYLQPSLWYCNIALFLFHSLNPLFLHFPVSTPLLGASCPSFVAVVDAYPQVLMT
jgi:hypothetical protein